MKATGRGFIKIIRTKIFFKQHTSVFVICAAFLVFTVGCGDSTENTIQTSTVPATAPADGGGETEVDVIDADKDGRISINEVKEQGDNFEKCYSPKTQNLTQKSYSSDEEKNALRECSVQLHLYALALRLVEETDQEQRDPSNKEALDSMRDATSWLESQITP